MAARIFVCNEKIFDIKRAMLPGRMDIWGIGKAKVDTGDDVVFIVRRYEGRRFSAYFVGLGIVISKPFFGVRTDDFLLGWRDGAGREPGRKVFIRYLTPYSERPAMDFPDLHKQPLFNAIYHRGGVSSIYRFDQEDYERFVMSLRELEVDASAKANLHVHDFFGYGIDIDIDAYDDRPVPKCNGRNVSSRVMRDPMVKAIALKRAGYQCELFPGHPQILMKGGKIYLETHHLIPMSMQDDFEYSLDVPANVIAVCPYAHRYLHHAAMDAEKRRLLVHLWRKRQPVLERCGIRIALDDLLRWYA